MPLSLLPANFSGAGFLPGPRRLAGEHGGEGLPAAFKAGFDGCDILLDLDLVLPGHAVLSLVPGGGGEVDAVDAAGDVGGDGEIFPGIDAFVLGAGDEAAVDAIALGTHAVEDVALLVPKGKPTAPGEAEQRVRGHGVDLAGGGAVFLEGEVDFHGLAGTFVAGDFPAVEALGKGRRAGEKKGADGGKQEEKKREDEVAARRADGCRLEGLAKGVEVGETFGRIGGEGAAQHGIDRVRALAETVELAKGTERHRAGEELPEGEGERVLIPGGVRSVAGLEHFWREIAGGECLLVGSGDALVGIATQVVDDAEIRDDKTAGVLFQQQVRWLDIAVDETGRV